MTIQPISRHNDNTLIIKTTSLYTLFGTSLRLSVLLFIIAPGLGFSANDSSSPREVTIGSTNTQINNALSLCKKYSEDCELDWYADEATRIITLKPYQLDLKEVSVGDFKKYVQSNNVTTEVEQRRSSAVTDENDPLSGYYADDVFWHNAYRVNNPKYPVVHVTFNDASGYCASVGKRLPTEAEWEYAARGGAAANSFPWGNNWEDASRYRGVALPQKIPTPVGSFQPNQNGFYDLSGNVAEWTLSDVPGAEDVVVKGGSRFSTNVANLRAAVRRLEDKEYSGDDVGFRCVKVLDKWPGSSEPLKLATNKQIQPTAIRIPEPNPEPKPKPKPIAEPPSANKLKTEAQQPQKSDPPAITIAQGPATAGNNSVRVDELLQRVKVMRKVREKKRETFSNYMTNSVTEAMSHLFDANPD